MNQLFETVLENMGVNEEAISLIDGSAES